MSNKAKTNEVKTSTAAEMFEWLELVIISACAVLLVFTFIIRPARVDGPSMEDTLHHNDFLILSDLFYTPTRGDVVVFQKLSSGHSEPIVKRVIATAGEKVDIDFDTWTVTVTKTDGNKITLDEHEYRKLATDGRVTTNQVFPITVGEDEIFVMGDNRNHSYDSRDKNMGLISTDGIIGRVLLRVFPFNKFGTLG